MEGIPFVKMQAIGNNFVLIDALELPQIDWQALAVEMCAHRWGIGSDGLLVILPSERADFRMRMFNPDGTEDVCGNGLRCAAMYVYTKGITDKRELSFEGMAGLHEASIVDDRGALQVGVNMGSPSLKPEEIPALLDVDQVMDYPLDVDGDVYRVTCVSVGTPHAVILAPLETFWANLPPVSSLIEVHPAFPERVSVTWCAAESPDALRIRTWERGVGPTLGCGTGACSALVAANLHGLVGEVADVTSPGGTLRVRWPGRSEVSMTGPAEMVFDGLWPLLGDKESAQCRK